MLSELSFQIIAYLFIGIFAGLAGGLLGMSGGVITVPCLVLVFHFIGIPKDVIMHLSIGTSLASMVFSAISSTYMHHLKGAILWDVFRGFALGIFLGGILGSFIARILPSEVLQVIFGFFECVIGIYLFFFKRKEVKNASSFPKIFGKTLLGFSISGISTVLGIGGGFVAVPVLLYYKMQIKKAIGTSAAMSMLITFLGAISFMIFGWGQHIYKETVGFLYIPAFIILSLSTAFTAPLGAKLAHFLPHHILQKIFSVALIVAGIMMIFS